MPRYIERPKLVEEYVNREAELPYGLIVNHILAAMEEVYDFLHDINKLLAEKGTGRRLEDTLLGNTFSGVLSEVIVRAIANNCPHLIANTQVGGFPDLLPRDIYPEGAVLQGSEGIEVKASIQPGGWQGHNPERGWYMVFRYQIDTTTMPLEEREPTFFVQVLAAQLAKDDWSFSGRKGTSRRTPTASITKSGMHKLRSNPVYQHPDYVIWPKKYSLKQRPN